MIRYFAGHPTASNLLMVALLIIGIMSAPNVKRETFPEIPAREVEVLVIYPGATPEDVEDAICQRIEDAVESIKHIEETRCDARENRGSAIIKMVEGKGFDDFLNDIKTEVEAIDNFPDQAEDPVIRKLGQIDFVASVAITGPMAALDLKAYAENLKDKMLEDENISQVKIKGFSDHQIRIEIPAQIMRQYGISVSDIANTIAQQSINLPVGSIETKESDVLIRFADERRNPLEFQDIVIVGAASGAEIRLGSIAKITDMFEKSEEKIIFNNQRAAILEVSKTKAEDTLKVIDAVKDFITKEKQRAPPSVSFDITRDISSIVRDRLGLLVVNGFQGLILVFLTLWLFFNIRFSFWVAMGFPVSFMGTIAMMSFVGLSFDLITMVGLLIAIGLLVDDAIVIAENIAAHMVKGLAPLEAAIAGTKQVAPGVISSFLTTICVFGSLAFIKGNLGSILKMMPIILLITLSVSLIEAFLILPHHIKESLEKNQGKTPSAFRLKLESAIYWLRDYVLAGVVNWTINWRYLSVGLTVMLFIASLSMMAGGKLKFRPFPDIEGDVIQARLLLPQGTPLSRTTEVVAHLTDTIGKINDEVTPKQPGGQALVKSINIGFNQNIDAYEFGPHIATITVDLLTSEQRTLTADEVMNRWRERTGKLPDVIALKYTEPAVGPAGRAIDIRIKGQNLDQLTRATADVKNWLNGYTGVIDLSDDLRPGKPEIQLKLRDGATALGLNAQMIALQLRSAFFGKTASEIQVGKESYEIDVRLAQGDKDSLGDLEYFSVTAPGGEQIPLDAVAVLESGRGYARLHRINRKRTISLQGDVDTNIANTAEILADMKKNYLPKIAEKYPDIEVVYHGEVNEGAKTRGSIFSGFALGLIGVYLLLSFLFRSYIEPLIVMIAIPMGLVGVIWGHYFLGLNMSMPSIVGFASLAGVVVNNAILMMEFIRIQRLAGDSAADAARHAARMRFRAVLLTSTTTIMGLLPLLTETSMQAQVLIPLVTSLAFGLFAATLLILLLMPALYTIFDDFGWTKIPTPDEFPETDPQPAE
ncbi:MAG: efflux RND transporter permease subunit [Rhodospirillaceae bacterium]|jgi:hydrophobic/amphiphilic exporter-1 (mainly G- bacteria), HAE1 family|nr:efflux RND transporter permease subunit [Rhodospirillaceae bacterium]MBT4589639.1 efflux RND transporter permease subunit [Rhodospirillaceae bacterium]MBT5939474.1 efflux RND transporter permease subunit [Rhodospirillaceae bacterium]MBT7269182.1 efflux RND transporter permease subunit [Rhodospirillaceae bacterium]